MKRRLLSLLLALALLCALLPAAFVSAAETETPADGAGFGAKAFQELKDPLPDPDPPAYSGKEPTRAPADWVYESNVYITINNLLIEALRAGKTTIDISAYGIDQRDVNLYALNYYSPYITSRMEVMPYYSVNTDLYTKLTITNSMSKSEINSYFARVDAKVAEIDAMLEAAPDALMKALLLHEYLAYNCEYDYDRFLMNDVPDDSYKSAGIIMDRIAVCQGYSYAFMYFMHRAKIECHVVPSDSMNHMWNMIKLGGSYYHIDVTWDDPTPDSLGLVRHNFFLLSDNAISGSRGGSQAHYAWTTPSVYCNDTSYENAFWYVYATKSPILYSDPYLYFSSGNKLIQRVWSSGAETVLTELGSWPKTSSSTFQNDSFTGLYLKGSQLFYNTATQIRCFNLNTHEDVAVYTPGSGYGSIFGTAVAGDTMYYAMKPYYTGTASKYSVLFSSLIPSCAHAYTTTQHKDATCTETGYDKVICTNCGALLSETSLAALGHSWNDGEVTVPATETSTGVMIFTCTRCDAKKTEEIPKLVHTHSYTDVVTAPTCTMKGYTTHTCACGDSYVDAETPALGHAWNDGVITVPATEETTGLKTFSCLRCGATKTEEIPKLAHTHSYKEVVTAPTCTEQGYTTFICACGDSYVGYYTAALGHDWLEGSIELPTETEDGVLTCVCTRCGLVKTAAVPATGEGACKHTYAYPSQKAPTCTEPGYDRMICEDCLRTVSEVILPATGHDLVTDEAVPATCTAPGLTAGSHCTRCDYWEGQTVVPALGHDYKNGACTRCGEKDPNYQPVAFNDVFKTEWYYDAVNYAVSYGLMNGVGSGRFAPNSPMTRAMLVTVLWRYEGSLSEGFNTFKDVPNGQWYTDAVAWAAWNGIVGGVGNNKFDPNGNITREQMAAILYRYAKTKGFDTSKSGSLSGFPDWMKVSAYADDAIRWTVAEGIISGSDGRLVPQGNATRAQVCAILMRFIENVAKK